MRTLVPSPVRVATPADVEAITALALAFLAAEPAFAAMGPASPAHVRAFVERMVTSEDRVAFVVENADRHLLGMIGAGLYEHQLFGVLTAQEVGWFVAPSARGGAVALLLFDEFERWGLAAGAQLLQVQSPWPAPVVGRFYRQRGYVTYEADFYRRVAA